MADEQVIRNVVKVIETQQRWWNQAAFLGTGADRHTGAAVASCYCLAGWACRQAGYDVAALLRERGNRAVFHAARHTLGLSVKAARSLFYFQEVEGRHPTIDELKHKITCVTGVTFP